MTQPTSQHPATADNADQVVRRGLATMLDIWDVIPVDWEKADIAIGTGIGSAELVRRISLHEDENGKRVILLHNNHLDVRK